MASEELQRARIDAGPARLGRLQTQLQINHKRPAQGLNLPALSPVAAWGHGEGVGTEGGTEPPSSPNQLSENTPHNAPPALICGLL